jgi:predicted dehydrogenase
MSTKISVWGTNGRITADRQECQIYLRTPHEALPNAKAGWTIKYTTDLTQEVWFYLRGEEYSAQIDYFVKAIENKRTDNVNSFRSALQADRLVSMILAEAGGTARPAPVPAAAAKGFWARRFG